MGETGMIDQIAMWFGYAVAAIGGLGVLALLSSWTLGKVIDAFELKRMFLKWCAAEYKKRSGRIPG